MDQDHRMVGHLTEQRCEAMTVERMDEEICSIFGVLTSYSLMYAEAETINLMNSVRRTTVVGLYGYVVFPCLDAVTRRPEINRNCSY